MPKSNNMTALCKNLVLQPKPGQEINPAETIRRWENPLFTTKTAQRRFEANQTTLHHVLIIGGVQVAPTVAA